MPDDPRVELLNRYRMRLLRGERKTAMALLRAYARAVERLRPAIEALTAYLAEHPESAGAAYRLSEYRALRNAIENEIGRYAVFAENSVSDEIEQAARIAQNQARALVLEGLPPEIARQVADLWRAVDVKSLQALVALTDPEGPLAASWRALGAGVAEVVGEALESGMIIGQNPRVIARLIEERLGLGLTWSLRTARTATLYAHRIATTASYGENPHLIKGWIWHAHLGDERTCMSCISLHGTKHSPDELLNDHHNGRCSQLPITPNWRDLGFDVPDTNPKITPGPEWFEGLPEEEQMRRMGPAKWLAWREGAIGWDDLSVEHKDPIYGIMRVEPALKSLVDEKDWRRFVYQEAQNG